MLQVRMVVALAVSAAFTLALVAAIVYLSITVSWLIAVLLVGFVLEGIGALGRRPKQVNPPISEHVRVEAALQRLCIVADVRVPRVRFIKERRPLCWTTALPSRQATIQLSVPMVEDCSDEQLEAVLAHELAHIVHGDAWVMTLMSGPLWIISGVHHYWEQRKQENWAGYVMGSAILGVPALVVSLPGALAARHLSRHRELAADRAAALFTGSPDAVASALIRISERLVRIPTTDLRSVPALTVLNWLPLRPERGGLGRLWATHPPLERRLDRLGYHSGR